MSTATVILWICLFSVLYNLFRMVRWSYKWLVRKYGIKENDIMYTMKKSASALRGKDGKKD